MKRRDFLIKGSLTTALAATASPAFIFDSFAQDKPLLVLIDRDVAPQILLAGDAVESEKYAAQELATYLKKISGREIPVATGEASVGAMGPLIVLGHHPLNADLNPAQLEVEESIISVEPNRLRIVGGKLPPATDAKGKVFVRDRGTLYGVYNFLDGLGVRWYAPGEENEFVPRQSKIELPHGRSRSKPTYRYRYGYYLWQKEDTPGLIWAIRNRMNVDTGAGKPRYGGCEGVSFIHSYASLVPQWKYFETHPEYFALIDGKRLKNAQAQLCVSNAEVQEVAAQAIVAQAKADPWRSIFSVEPNDGALWCECENCKAWDDPKLMGSAFGLKKPSMSNRVAKFSNIVAKKVEQVVPGTQVGWLAYNAHAEAPTLERQFEPNTNVMLAANPAMSDYSRMLRDPAPTGHNVRFVRALEGYKGLTRLFTYEYWSGYAWVGPLPVVNVMHDRLMQYNRDFGVVGTYCEPQYHWASQGMIIYLFTRLTWNPNRDINAEMAEYCRNVFGPAAAPILEYHNALEAASLSGPMYHAGGSYIQRLYLKNDALFAKLKPLIEQAAQLAKGKEPYEKRVRGVQYGYEIARLTYDTGTYFDRGQYLQAVDAMQQIREIVLGKSDEGMFDRGMFNLACYPYMVALNDPYRKSSEKLTALKGFTNIRILSDLNDNWRYLPDSHETGMARGLSQAKFNDDAWKVLSIAKGWRQPAYAGDAWYRRSFDISQISKDRHTLLYIGPIDGDATIYCNGQKIELPADTDKSTFAINVTDKVRVGQNTLALLIKPRAVQNEVHGGLTLLQADVKK